MRIEELDIEVEDVSEFNDEASEILTGFCQGLENEGMIKPADDDDRGSLAEDENIKFWWDDKASTMIRAKIDELYAIGNKYFGKTLDLDISTSMFREL